jgi:hypothetical protein
MSKKTGLESKVMEQTITMEIRFKLSAEEQQKMANAAAALTEERNATKTELDLIGRTMRKKIKDQQKEIDRLLKAHSAGTEARETEVVQQMDWAAKMVRFYHTTKNGGELIEEREMHDTELQMKLDTNPTAKKVRKDNRTRAQKNPDKHLTPAELAEQGFKDPEIAEVHSMESKRKTKRSSVDGHAN